MPLMYFRGQRLPARGRVWVFIVAAAMFGNSIPFALVSWGQVKVDAGLTAILMAVMSLCRYAVMPLITVLLARVFLDETLPSNAWLALFTIMVGIGLSRMSNANTVR